MDYNFDVIITPDAENDLIEIRNYIIYKICEPEIAIRYIRRIKRDLQKLSTMALSIKIEDEEPLHSFGIRKMIVENYYAYYEVNEEFNEVYVLDIIYKGRDQLEALNL